MFIALWLRLVGLFEYFVHDIVPWVMWWGAYGLFVIGVTWVCILVAVLVSRFVWEYVVGGLLKLGVWKWVTWVVGICLSGVVGAGSVCVFWTGVFVPVLNLQYFPPNVVYRVAEGVFDGSLTQEAFWKTVVSHVRYPVTGAEMNVRVCGVKVDIYVPARTVYGYNWATVAFVCFSVIGGGVVLYLGCSG